MSKHARIRASCYQLLQLFLGRSSTISQYHINFWEKLFFRFEGGEKQYYFLGEAVLYRSTKSADSAATVRVVVAGPGHSSLAVYLAEMGHDVWVLELRGHGRSLPKPTWLETLLAQVSAAAVRVGCSRASS
jgi:hypothetical protein